MRILLAIAAILACPGIAAAHPHMFVDARAEIQFDPQGRIVGIKNIWRFDEAFSAYAKQGLDRLPNGRLTAKSLEALARVNIHSLALYKYFTFQRLEGKHEPLGEGSGQKLEDDGERLTLSFTVAVSPPLETAGRQVTLDLYDPEYFVAMSFEKTSPVRMVGAPKACKLQVFTPSGLSAAAAAALASVPASQRTLPKDLQGLTSGIENGAVIDCTAAE
jgi:ABC-type uncharacterized transport system substrate-binding protein